MVVSWNEIKKAHRKIDNVVNKCDTNKCFKNGEECVEFLFGLCEKYIEEL